MSKQIRSRQFVLPAMLVMLAGQAQSLRAQEAVAPSAPINAAATAPGAQPPATPAAGPAPAVPAAAAAATATATAPAAVTPPVVKAQTISFAFKDTPWDQVLDFLARQTGLPVISEATAPVAPVTFISAGDYTIEEALDVVNKMLWVHGLQVRREPTVLMLSKLEDSKARSRQYVGQIPEAVVNSEVVTLVLPLNFALASQLAEKLNAAGMIGKGGALVPLPQQNSLVIVETAAQVRRIRDIVTGLDNKPAADSQIKLFALEHAEAATIFTTLRALVAEKRQTIIIDKDGQQRKVNDEVFEGLTIQPDPRTNSLLAVGTPAKLKTVEELIRLLDKPEGAGSGGREMTTFAMGSVSPEEAAVKLRELFVTTPEKQRPTLLTMPAQGKLLLIGSAAQAAVASGLLAELDPGSSAMAAAGGQPVRPAAESRAVIVALSHVRGDAAQAVLAKLLSPRQTAAVRLAAMPDQKGLIVSGPAADVEMVKQLVAGLDTPGQTEREVKMLRVGSGDLDQIVAKAKALYEETGRAQREPVTATIEKESRTVALVGSKSALATMTELLTSVQAGTSIDRETVTIVIRNFKPSDLTVRMQRLVRPMLEPRDGSDYVAPTIEPVDELSMLVVRASTEQLKTISDLVTKLDTQAFGGTGIDGVGPVELRSFRLRQASPTAVATAVRQLIGSGGGGIPMAQQGAVTMTTDEASKMLIVTGPVAIFATIEKVLGELDMQSPGSVVVKAVRVNNARCERIAPLVQSLMERDPNSFRSEGAVVPAAAPTPARGGGARPAGGARAGAGSAGAAGAGGAGAGGAGDSAMIRDPLKVVAEPRSNSLILTGPIELISVAEKVIAELDVDVTAMPAAGGARTLRVVTLNTADANDAAQAVTALFTDDPSGTPPTVKVDKNSNSLLVRGTESQLKAIDDLVMKLDQATASASRDMRIIQVDRSKADAAVMAETLRRLLQQRQGVKVEVISAEDLIKRGEGKEGGKKDEPKKEEKKTGMIGGRGVDLALWTIAASVMAVEAGEPEGVEKVAAAVPGAVEAAAVAAQPPAEPSGAETGITIAVDPVTNSLIIVGAPKMTQRAFDLATQLQQQMPSEPSTLHIVTLSETSDARTLAVAINGLIVQMGPASATNPGGLTGRVSVQADPDGDALIISANETDFRVVGELVGAMARPKTATGVTVKVYPLINAPAWAVMQAGRDLFSASPQGRQAQRLRQIDVAIGEDGKRAVIDPSLIRFTTDPAATSVIVSAPPAAIPTLDRFIAMLDQTPASTSAGRVNVRMIPVKNAKASDVAKLLQQSFDGMRRGLPQGGVGIPQATFSFDDRTNMVIATAADAQLKQVDTLLPELDRSVATDGTEVAMIPLAVARPSSVQRIVDAVLSGRDPGRKDRISISAADDSSLFVVRGTAEQIEEVRKIVAEVDKSETGGLPVRTVKLERSDAVAVATSLKQFFEDRARVSAKGGQRGSGAKVSIVGDRRSGTIVYAATADDEEQIKTLVATLDGPATTRQYEFKVIPLAKARLADVRSMMESLLNQLRFDMFSMNRRGGGGGDQSPQGAMVVEFDERANAVVFMGAPDQFESVERIVHALDIAAPQGATLEVRAVRLAKASPAVVASAINSAMDPMRKLQGRWSGGPSASDVVRVEVDAKNRTLVMVGRQEQLETAVKYAEQLDAAAGDNQTIETIALKFAAADRVATNLDRFFRNREGERGGAGSPVQLIGSKDGNVLVVSGGAKDIELVRTLLAQIDQPEEDSSRVRELFKLTNGDASEIAQALREQFPATLASREGLVTITPQASTNSVLVSAPKELAERIKALIEEMDSPPTGESSVVTVVLSTARADDVAASLTQALPKTIKVKITPVRANNSLLLTGGKEAVAVVMVEVKKLDSSPVRAAVEFRRLKLANASSSDIAPMLRQIAGGIVLGPNEARPVVSTSETDNTVMITASAGRIDEIAKVIEQMDVATKEKRRTEFVTLKNADAEQIATALSVFYGPTAPQADSPGARAVSVIANPAGKSLIISAEEQAWQGIRGLIEKLDSDIYDPSRRYEVVALKHADAVLLAKSLTEAFNGLLTQQRQDERRRPQFNFRSDDAIVLQRPGVDAREAVTIAAEPLTNSLIIAATKDQADRIKALAAQLDVPESAKLPEAHIIALRIGPASQIAQALRQAYTEQSKRNIDTPAGRAESARAVVIVGEDKSNTLIVRAEEPALAQIRALAETLQQEGDRSRSQVRVITLKNVPASRVAMTLRTTFAGVAKEGGETLAIEVDRVSNMLVIASSEKIFTQVKKVVDELDAIPSVKGREGADIVPGLGQTVQIVDLENNGPAEIQRMIEAMGVTKAQLGDRQGVVVEPVTVVALSSRRALALVGAPGDNLSVAAVIKALDAAPAFAEQHVALVRLKNASAIAVSTALENMLKPSPQDADTSPAKALAEQVRRLSVHKGVNPAADSVSQIALDISKPVRVYPDASTNTVVIASTKENVAALREIAAMMDTLPLGPNMVLRMFPLETAAAQRVATTIRDLFKQTEAISIIKTLPNVRTEPGNASGKALASAIAITVDDRTNTLLVAGPEESVAMVEVLVKQLDGSRTSGWIEPVVLPLKHADPRKLAATLRSVFVEGVKESPEAAALQRAIGRISIAISGKDPQDPANRVNADLFASLSSIVIVPAEQVSAIIVVGSTSNIAAMKELIKMLDVPAAAASNTVRLYSLQFAAAERIAGLVRDVFRQQLATGAIKPEDDVVVTSDMRTNSLIVSTSGRSFAVVESLLAKLDGEQASPSVSLHVVAVPQGNAAILAPKIETLMRERIDAQARSAGISQPRDVFSVTAEPQTSSLIVACSKENLEIVKQLIDVLAKGAEALDASRMADVIVVKSAKVDTIALAVTELYVQKENRTRGVDAVRVSPDQRLNALIVSGTARDIEAIKALVTRLDGQPVTAVTEIKRIELKKTDSVEAVRLIQSVLAGRALAGGGALGQRQALLLKFLRDAKGENGEAPVAGPNTQAEISGTVQEQVTVTAEPRTNSIYVVAPAQVMVLIESIVSDLDGASAGAREIEVFELVNADARQMATVLKELFSLKQNNNTLTLVPGRVDQRDPNEPPVEGGLVDGTFFPTVDERQQLAITIDVRTNSLIVSATREYLAQVKQVVERLDAKEISEREQITVKLRNAKALDVAKTLKEYFLEESNRVRQLLGPDRVGSLATQFEREVTITGDDKSGSLIVSVSPKYREIVSNIIKELDATPPQVLIQVLLAEVSLDQSNQFGIEGRFGPLGGEALRGTYLGAGNPINNALGVPNFSVSTNDFQLLVRALESQGRLEILSRPQITVRNNETGKFQVGENIGLPDSIQQFSNGNNQTAIRRQDVGIILDVTPQVNDDGYIRMDIKPQISALTARTTQINETLESPVITKREVQTIVTVKDGETVVIGGLIQDTEELRKTRVPGLSDIPLVGEIFKSNKYSKTKTELLILVTPRVVRSGQPGALESMREHTEQSVDRMSDPDRIRRLVPPMPGMPRSEPESMPVVMPPAATRKETPPAHSTTAPASPATVDPK